MNRLIIVGIGPGNLEQMTYGAGKALEESDLIVGYTVYVDLLRTYFPEKTYYSTAMKQETERVRYAIAEAQKGKTVAVVSSGDSGIYGMAGLAYELAVETDNLEIQVIAGVTAAVSGAAVLGAPLVHDFAVISLSDLLTPWERIEKRLSMAAQGDFVICIYNPSSKKRHDYLQKACDILLCDRKKDTVCAVVRNIGREGESYEILTLEELRTKETDMFTTVFVGNSQTKVIRGKMVTPRGYHYV